ncbi:MAG: DUF305 domain-containing protein [Pyrinomonadaceae bacterium]
MLSRTLLYIVIFTVVAMCSTDTAAQEPVIVRPGAPGEATKTLPSTTRPSLPPTSAKDVEFMQGMIMHHAQAVVMTDMIDDRTQNRDVRLLGERISKSQTDEMAFMVRWLQARGQSTEMKMAGGDQHSSHAHGDHQAAPSHQMPGMLSPKQMEELKAATGAEFDLLFLNGMIQHHEGALVMVKDLHDSPGTAQDAELFNFASDVDSGQRAEIKSMQNLLGKSHVEKKP